MKIFIFNSDTIHGNPFMPISQIIWRWRIRLELLLRLEQPRFLTLRLEQQIIIETYLFGLGNRIRQII